MTCALLWIGLLAGQVTAPPLVDAPWPRAFFFRASEGQARSGRVPYETWAATFGRLGGLMGKIFDEEIPGTSGPNVPFFTRFKREHPDQLVLVHYNGNARDPRAAQGFFPGHFVHQPGAALRQAVGPADTVLPVTDAGGYRLTTGRYDDRPEDLLLGRLVEGRLDFAGAEQVELVAVDTAARTITVRRGRHGTPARAFPAGETVVEHHVAEGPWGQQSNLLWHYNWSLDCPRDAQGRTAADVFVAECQQRFGPGGDLALLDGVEFDVLGWSRTTGDYDGDHRVDGGQRDGVNRYGLGVLDLCRRLREALPDKLWLADGASGEGLRNQRACGVLHGIESEGWPDLHDGELVDWSGGLNRHRYWTTTSPAPAFSYVNHKFERGGVIGRTPLNFARLVQAACLLTDSAFTFAMAPPAAAGEPLGVYDELVGGALRRTGWLGRPLGPPVALAATAPDQLAGHLLLGDQPGGRVAVRDGVVTLTPRPGRDLHLTLARLDLPAGEVTLRARVRTAAPLPGMPAAVPRYVRVGLAPVGELLGPGYLVGQTRRGGEPGPLEAESGAFLRDVGRLALAGEAHHALYVHPPYRDGATGETWWERPVEVPEAGRLRFFTAQREAPNPSDGVTYAVSVTAPGAPAREVFREHRRSFTWQPAEVDLTPWAGQTVTLRCHCDAGPQDHTVADQAYWGDVTLRPAGRPAAPRGEASPATIMTWAGPAWFAASWYFREVAADRWELAVEAEADAPLELADLALHRAPDLWFRAYEHGAVLANPSLRPATFDLAALSPGVAYRRLQGTPAQDPQLNHGGACAATEAVPARDALFLIRQ